ncbi:hypothetical protein Tco_0824565 [Tanacetum coccineum]|uniref:Uncharacterized protein n=1 Tax=Tanacetum coccineum TaxID=301880 RepID=A0ABQ5AL51_9ASTR
MILFNCLAWNLRKIEDDEIIRQDIRRSLYGRFSFYDPRSGYQQKDRKPSQNDKTEHGMEKTVQNQGQRSGYHQKDRKPSQNDKTEHGMEKTVQNQGQSPKNDKVRVNTEESAVKPEPELKNTIECNLYPSDGPGKPNSISMKTVKTKWALNQLQQPICVQLTKTVKTLKAQS